eukprot:953027-Amphidinium_carterae.1
MEARKPLLTNGNLTKPLVTSLVVAKLFLVMRGANGGAAENNWVISADDLIAASRTGKRGHRNFDIVGDVAILQGFSPLQEDAGAEVGAILKEHSETYVPLSKMLTLQPKPLSS